MKYLSTRDASLRKNAAEVIAQGLSRDGGLFTPEQFPVMPEGFLEKLMPMSYQQRAVEVMSLYLDDFTKEELADYADKAYKLGEKFDTAAVAPVYHLTEGTEVLELWHGPTCAFKDMALQMLPHLLTASLRKNGETRTACILVATSGDTGKAALEGFCDVDQTRILVFYPKDGVSDIQKLQMVTQKGENVGVCAVIGNFDDAQTGVKQVFAACKGRDLHGAVLSSANSINIGRLAPQVVYYFRAYGDLVKAGRIALGDKVNFVVPTGNFGDILAGYFAKEMGLPVGRLVCASNANDVLTEFISTGRYDRRRPFYKTTSPSMDILVSSNLERLLFLLSRDPKYVAGLMGQLNTDGAYQLSDDLLAKLQQDFSCGCCDDQGAADVIGRLWSEQHYLCDPHTAVAWSVAEQLDGELRGTGAPTVLLSTASPYKFPAAVLSALGQPGSDNEFHMMNELARISGVPIPGNLSGLEGRPVLHKDVIDKDAMLDYVLAEVLKK